MGTIELAGQCNKCGRWSGLNTSNLHSATLLCKSCGHKVKVRTKKGFNINVKIPSNEETLAELVARLNKGGLEG